MAWGRWALTLLMGLVALCTLWFVDYALHLGVDGMLNDLTDRSRLYSKITAANVAVFGHMIMGAVITLLAPLQLIPHLRRWAPAAHRWSGRVLVVAALLTALGGLVYMALRGTVGGLPMTLAFSLYGVLVIGAAIQTIQAARAGRWQAHQDWAVRLFFLCIASLLYRLHYGLWFAVMGERADTYVQDDFLGAFDLVNIWAFYLPYLLSVELTLAARGRGLFRRRARSAI